MKKNLKKIKKNLKNLINNSKNVVKKKENNLKINRKIVRMKSVIIPIEYFISILIIQKNNHQHKIHKDIFNIHTNILKAKQYLQNNIHTHTSKKN